MEIKNAEFKELVQDNKGELIIVDFFANWCGPCRMLGPVIEEVCQDNNVKLYKKNITQKLPFLLCFLNI